MLDDISLMAFILKGVTELTKTNPPSPHEVEVDGILDHRELYFIFILFFLPFFPFFGQQPL